MYRRRQPEKTLLHHVIRENLNTFLGVADRRAGGRLPQCVRAEFSRFLDCGILANGFARVRCVECGYDTVVGFSWSFRDQDNQDPHSAHGRGWNRAISERVRV